MKPRLIKYMVYGIPTLLMVGCATTQAPGTGPQDMSFEEHLAAAAKEKQEADEHAKQYDPNAVEQETDRITYVGDEEVVYPGKIYNPTEHHKMSSEKQQEFARQHAAAAEDLARFRDAECADVEESIRRLCPLIGTVDRVEKTRHGARLFIAEGIDLDKLYSHARCHHAFGAHAGHKDMPNCPLYMKNVSLKKTHDGAIEIESKDKDAAAEILRRAEAHVAP